MKPEKKEEKPKQNWEQEESKADDKELWDHVEKIFKTHDENADGRLSR